MNCQVTFSGCSACVQWQIDEIFHSHPMIIICMDYICYLWIHVHPDIDEYGTV